MPYISEERRERIDNLDLPQNAGELNYLLTSICLEYIMNRTRNYQHINDVLGALEGCKLEFYRRLAAPYEDRKILEHGDVY
jgi:hypothetical protein